MRQTSSDQIEACIFDMGKVLIEFCHERMLRQIAEVCQHDALELKRFFFETNLLFEYETGMHTEEQMHEMLEAEVGRKIDRAEVELAASDIFEPMPEMLPVIESLHRQGMPLVLLSNTSRIHFEFLKGRYPVLDYFQDYALSYEARSMKPDPDIYHYAVKMTGKQLENCFFTDDKIENVEGAERLGMKAVQFQSAEQLTESLAALGVIL